MVTLMLLYNLGFQNDPVSLLKCLKVSQHHTQVQIGVVGVNVRCSGRELFLSIPIIQIACSC